MVQLLVSRTSFMAPAFTMMIFGVWAIQRPTLWLLMAYLAYRLVRAAGVGSTLGHRELLRLDSAVIGGILWVNGAYALLCRGIQTSGAVCMAILTAIFVKACLDANERVGWMARAVIAFAWCALTYRYFVAP